MEPQLRMTSQSAFTSSPSASNNADLKSHLKYIELPDTLRYLAPNTFYYLRSLEFGTFENPIFTLPDNLLAIGEACFQRAFVTNSSCPFFKIPSSVVGIAKDAFKYFNTTEIFQFGEEEKGSQLAILDSQNFILGENPSGEVFTKESSANYPAQLYFYLSSNTQETRLKELFFNEGAEHQTVMSLFVNMDESNRHLSHANNYQQ